MDRKRRKKQTNREITICLKKINTKETKKSKKTVKNDQKKKKETKMKLDISESRNNNIPIDSSQILGIKECRECNRENTLDALSLLFEKTSLCVASRELGKTVYFYSKNPLSQRYFDKQKKVIKEVLLDPKSDNKAFFEVMRLYVISNPMTRIKIESESLKTAFRDNNVHGIPDPYRGYAKKFIDDYLYLVRSNDKEIFEKKFVYKKSIEEKIHPEISLVLDILENAKKFNGQQIHISASKRCCMQCFLLIKEVNKFCIAKNINISFETRESSNYPSKSYTFSETLKEYLINPAKTIKEIKKKMQRIEDE